MSEKQFQEFLVEQLSKSANQVGAVQDDVVAVKKGQRVLRKSVVNIADRQQELHKEISLLRNEIAEVKEELRPAH